jgi:branched-chain amino acid transport system permease protein
MHGTPSMISGAMWLIALLAASLILPLFTPDYGLYLFNLLLTYAILAIGLDILIGWSGQFAFAHISFFGIGAYTTVLVQTRLGLPFVVGALAGVILSCVIAVLIAVPATRLRTAYLALATIAFSETVRWICNQWTAVTRGPDGIRVSPPNLFGYIVENDARALPIVAVSAAAMIAATMFLFTSTWGRALAAVRESEPLAAVSGINTQKMKTIAFALSAIYAAIAGSCYTLFQSFVNPDIFGFNQLIIVLTMVIVGGSGSVAGVLVGVALIGVLPEVLRTTMSQFLVWQELVYGIILLLCMMYLPEGVYVALRKRLATRTKP